MAKKPEPQAPAADSMQQVRELLFGEYQRRVDAQLAETGKALAQLGEDTRKAHAQLDQATRSAQQEMEAALREELSRTRQALEQRIEDLQASLERALKELERDTHKQLDNLDAAKVDRGVLAGLMRQLADQLDGQDG